MKKAIYTIMIGNNPMFKYTYHSMDVYARRIGADLIVRSQQLTGIFPSKNLSITTACAEKFFVEDLLETYDRVLYLDADVLIHPNAPDIFSTYSDVKKFYGFHEAAYDDRAFCVDPLIKYTGYKGGWKKIDDRYLYFNGGVFLCSKQSNIFKHKSIEEFRYLYGKIAHLDQTYFSYLVQKSNTESESIDHRFNRMNWGKEWWWLMGDFETRFDAYFIHYAGAGYSNPPSSKPKTLENDFIRLYGVEAASNLGVKNTAEDNKLSLIHSDLNCLNKAKHGYLLYNKNDNLIGASIHHYGEWSEGEVNLFQQVIRPGNFVVEIGANIGAHTVFFAKQIGTSGTVLAFETQRLNFQMLCANLALNNLTNTHVYPFNLKTDKTLDSFNLPRCQFIKLDASGKEWNVLQGATETIKKYHPFLYVKNEWEDKTLIQFVQSLGYKLYWHMPSIVNKANFYNNPANIYARALITKNMFCVPEGLNVTMQGFREIEC